MGKKKSKKAPKVRHAVKTDGPEPAQPQETMTYKFDCQWVAVKPPLAGYLADAKKGPVLAVSLYANASHGTSSEVLQFPAECAWRWTLIAGLMMLEIVEKAGTDKEQVVAQINQGLVRYVASPQYFFRDSSYKVK